MDDGVPASLGFPIEPASPCSSIKPASVGSSELVDPDGDGDGDGDDIGDAVETKLPISTIGPCWSAFTGDPCAAPDDPVAPLALAAPDDSI